MGVMLELEHKANSLAVMVGLMLIINMEKAAEVAGIQARGLALLVQAGVHKLVMVVRV